MTTTTTNWTPPAKWVSKFKTGHSQNAGVQNFFFSIGFSPLLAFCRGAFFVCAATCNLQPISFRFPPQHLVEQPQSPKKKEKYDLKNVAIRKKYFNLLPLCEHPAGQLLSSVLQPITRSLPPFISHLNIWWNTLQLSLAHFSPLAYFDQHTSNLISLY